MYRFVQALNATKIAFVQTTRILMHGDGLRTTASLVSTTLGQIVSGSFTAFFLSMDAVPSPRGSRVRKIKVAIVAVTVLWFALYVARGDWR